MTGLAAVVLGSSFTHTMTMTTGDEDYGFPAGYFVVRSAASDRLLDVAGEATKDGSELILYPEKEKSLVEGALLDNVGAELKSVTDD